MKRLAMDMPTVASQSLTGAPTPVADGWHDIEWRTVTHNVKRLQTRIVKAIQENHVLLRKAFERLERYAVKIVRTVLRGGSDSNITSLPDNETQRLAGYLSGVESNEDSNHAALVMQPLGRSNV
ncbi:MAG: reverse transcriptase N-terminal domain-containing protein [Ardenticatenaceae bacterium]|nr:reverse transcriptase N-terminal domain-containing protein [Ardenticatenaceae bacterium]